MSRCKTITRILSLSLVTILGGCSSKAEPEKQAGDKNAAEKTVPETAMPSLKPSQPKADFPEMSAADFAKEFNADESAAAAKYKNKDMVISGTIVEKLGDPAASGGIRLILEGDKSDKPLNVRAELGMFDAYTMEQFKKLKPGDTVKVNGTILFGKVNRKEGQAGDVELNMCKIVN